MTNKGISIYKEAQRIKVIFKRNDNHIPTAWEISNFIENFSSNYLKIGIINQIADLVNQGVSPKNIFILDQSFDLHQKYDKLDNLKLFHKIHMLYPIGLPIGLMPSDNIFAIKTIFKHFRTCNELLFLHDSKRMTRKSINQYSYLFFNKDISLENIIRSITDEAINNARNSKKLTNVKKNDAVKKYENAFNKTITETKKYESESVMFSGIEEILCGDNVKLSELTENQNDMLNKYYRKFYHFLSKVSRPMVCYYDDDLNVKILGVGNINVNKRDKSFIDIKSISHNSPVLKEIIMGMTGGITTLIETVNDEKRKNEIHKKKLEQEDKQISILGIEEEIAKEKLLQERIETATRLAEIMENANVDEVKNVDNKYIRMNLRESQMEYQKRAQKVIYNNKLSVIDVEEIKSDVDIKI